MISNVDGYIYTSLKNKKFLIEKRKVKERDLIKKVSKFNNIKVEFQSDLIFNNLIASLDQNLAKLLILKYKENLTVREIGKITNTPKSTVQDRIKKAHKILKNKIS